MSDSEKKGVLIVEDHTLIREGLRSLLSSHPDLEVSARQEMGGRQSSRLKSYPRP